MTRGTEHERFVVEQTRPGRAPLVPEIDLLLAHEVTPLWHATEAWLEGRGVPPPYWAFAWAGGQALARLVLDRGVRVDGRRVLDFACGGGVVSVAAAMRGAADVRAVDVDPFAAAATKLNAARNGAQVRVECADLLGTEIDADVVLCGDVFYDRAMSERVEPWLRTVARRGAEVFFGDPGRSYVPTAGVQLCATFDVETPLELESAATKRTNVYRLAP